MKQENYRLGLDVGTNSLGWCVARLNSRNEPDGLLNAGVKIFTDGRESKSQTTLKGIRREKRSARRNRDRKLARNKSLITNLKTIKLLPINEAEFRLLQYLNPYQLRAKAINEKMPLYHIGIALIHLNKHRGFKSSRKNTEEMGGGKYKENIQETLINMGLLLKGKNKDELAKMPKNEKIDYKEKEFKAYKDAFRKLKENKNISLGKFLYTRNKKNKPVRIRKDSDEQLYDFFPTRELVQDEFNKIWENQKQYYPNILTKENKNLIENIIFFQRPLKSQADAIGNCSFLKDEKRMHKAMPSFQKYRIYSDVNHLAFSTPDGENRIIDFKILRDEIVDLMENPSLKGGNVSFAQIKTICKNNDLEIDKNQINLSRSKLTLTGNTTTFYLSKEGFIGEEWHNWDLDKQDEFIALFLSDREEEDIRNEMITDFGLTDIQVEEIFTLENALEEGVSRISKKAANMFVDKMKEDFLTLKEAEKISRNKNKPLFNKISMPTKDYLDELPYYGEVFQNGEYIITGTHKKEDINDKFKYWGGVSNPTVHIALNQIRHVTNSIIKKYGKPESISIEMGRDLPNGTKKRKEIYKLQNKNKQINNKLNEELEELSIAKNRDNKLKLKLLKESNYKCIYTGEIISESDLFSRSRKVDIDHILPYSDSLDDGTNNKVVCLASANRNKSNKIPYDAFKNNPKYNWDEIFTRSQELPASKRWRFDKDAWDKWNKSNPHLSRHLNDTRYVAKLARKYLQNICPNEKIYLPNGSITSECRYNWGLNSLLSNNNSKNRNDHRHHAIDAIVIAMLDDKIIKKILQDLNNAKGFSLPYNNFRKDVDKLIQNIIVSHKKKYNKINNFNTGGSLHEETAYGIISEPNENNKKYKVQLRKNIEDFEEKHLKKIKDEHLKSIFTKEWVKNGENGFLQLARDKNIRRIRLVLEKPNLIPIKDKNGKNYKGFISGNNWGMEIWEYPLKIKEGNKDAKKTGKWEMKIITQFERAQNDFKLGETTKPHPGAKLVMRLHKNDCIKIKENETIKTMKVQKIGTKGIFLAEHYEANTRKRIEKGEFKYLYIQSIKKLKTLSYN